MKPDTRKSLPGSKAGNLVDSMREALQTAMGFGGDKLDRAITVRDLAGAGLIDVSKIYLAGGSRNPIARVNTAIGTPGTGGTIIIGGDTYEPDLTPPPTPSGFTVGAGISYLYIECANQTYTVGHGHGVTKVYGAKRTGGTAPTYSDAVLLTTFGGTVTAYPTDPSTEWHLWVTWVTKDGVESTAPAGGTNGQVATTGTDVRLLLDALSDAATSLDAPYTRFAVRANLFYVASDSTPAPQSVFSVVSAPIMVNGVMVPVGVYMREGFIQNGTITNLKVANGAIDNLKVANVSADKLTAGTIAVGQYIQSTNYTPGQSGWKINGIGNVEFNSAVFRGQAFVGGGTVGGILIAPTYLQSSNYDGKGNGFRLGADGVFDLPGGSVSALQLNVGAGANLLANSTWVDRAESNAIPTAWSYALSEPTGSYARGPGIYTGSFPLGVEGVVMTSGAPGPSGSYMLLYARFSVIPGRRYEMSIYAGSQRCNAYTDIEWYNAAGVPIGRSSDLRVDNTNGLDFGLGGGQTLANFKQIGCFGIAPAGAAYGLARYIKSTTTSGASSYVFMMMPYVGLATDKQTKFSDYSPSGIGTRVTPGGITTPSLSALNAILGDCYAGSLRGGSFSGYGWPGNGDGGFYLGPEGLLLGNANAGRYFQVTRDGYIYTPGFNIENGVMTVTQANIIGTANIQGGAVMTLAQARGFNGAQIGIYVPPGQVHLVHLIATWDAILYDANVPKSTTAFVMDGMPGTYQFNQSVAVGFTGGDAGYYIYAYYSPAFTMTSLLTLGPGSYSVGCNSDSGSAVTLIANIARRP